MLDEQKLREFCVVLSSKRDQRAGMYYFVEPKFYENHGTFGCKFAGRRTLCYNFCEEKVVYVLREIIYKMKTVMPTFQVPKSVDVY